MRLHRALGSDWSRLPAEQHNVWQRLAVRSGGILTPANAISVLGGIIVILGLLEAVFGSLVLGLVAIALGRIADILDGFIAEITGTKSPLGEAVDAAIDKIVICLALITLLIRHLVPLAVGLVIAVHTIYNIGLWLRARSLKTRLHPSPIGKLATALAWLSIGLYLYGDKLRSDGQVSAHDARLFAASVFGLFIATGLWSSLTYTQILHYKRVKPS